MPGKTLKLVMIISLLYITSNIFSSREVEAYLEEVNAVRCPVCGGEVKIFKTLSMTVKGSYRDFQRKINGPYYFQLFSSCPACHFSGYASDFSREVSEEIKHKVLAELKSIPVEALNINMFEFAAKIYIWEKRDYAEIAQIYLFGSYYLKYRSDLKGKRFENLRKRYQAFACEYFIKTLEAKEIKEKDRGAINYLIGDLYRRQGEFEKAIYWYDIALKEKNPDEFRETIQEQKEMARNRDADNDI